MLFFPSAVIIPSMLLFVIALLIAAVRLPRALRPEPKAVSWWLSVGVLLMALGMAGFAAFHDLTVQKLLGRLLMPLGLLWMALIVVIALCLRTKRWRASLVVGGVWLGLTLAGNAWVATALIRQLESGIVMPTCDAAAPWDAVLVCGGGTGLTPDGTPQLASSGDRVSVGARMLRGGYTRRLIACGSGIDGLDSGRNLADETATIWQSWGIPADAIEVLNGPRTTREELAAFAELARTKGWQRIAVISSAWHLPRVQRQAQRAGIGDITLIPADWLGRGNDHALMQVVPAAGPAATLHLAAWELLGRWAGR